MESSTPEVSMEVQQQKVFTLLHILMGYNRRNHRLTSRVLEPENYFVSMMKDAVLDSPMIVDSLTVLSPENENEVLNVPKEHVEDNLPKFHPPRKGLSAIRTFPPGCGRGAPPVRIRNGLQKNGSRAKKSDRDDTALAEVAKKSSVESRPGASPISGRTESEDPNEDGSMGGMFSRGFDHMKSDREDITSCPEPMAERVVVQALTAAPNCPWRQGKKTFKSMPTNTNLEGKEL